MILSRNEILSFVEHMFSMIQEFGVDPSSCEFDHVAYRCLSLGEYGMLKEMFLIRYVFVSEEEVNGRPISLFRFRDPIPFSAQSIGYIELIAPSEKSYRHGLEHIEFVISEDPERFASRYPHLEFIRNDDKEFNPELVLPLADGYRVKFHARSLLEVLELRKAASQEHP